MEDLYIKWETGYMNIHMNFFFPCSQERFKLPVSKDEWKRAKADLKVYKAAYNKALSNAKANKRDKEQFEKYLKSL